MLARLLTVAWLGVGGLVACVDDVATPSDERMPVAIEVAAEDVKADDASVDVCALAARLPSDDICSLVCDYDAFAQRALENGMESGACYSFRCAYDGGVSANVGVCAP